jgi:hypothetical protein
LTAARDSVKPSGEPLEEGFHFLAVSTQRKAADTFASVQSLSLETVKSFLEIVDCDDSRVDFMDFSYSCNAEVGD